MSDPGDIIEVTADVEFAIIGDRLHFTLISGPNRHPYAITFGKAERAGATAIRLVGEAMDRDNVSPFCSGCFSRPR
jgi:hypothetical protein